MASAAFHFAAQASGLKYAGAAAGTVVATLDSVNGVDYANWTIDGTDELSSGQWSLSASTGNSITVNFPASGTGKAMVLRCTVNGDPDLTATAKVYIAPEVGAVGEQSESDANFGQGAFINPMLRSLGGFTSATSAATPSTLAARDGSGNSAFVGLTASTLTSTANLTLTAAAAGYVSVFENATEIARIQDVGGRRVIQLQGTGDVSSTGSLRLDSAGGTSLFEDGVEVCTAAEAAGVASLTGPAATAFRLAATTASAALRLSCGAGGTVQIIENATNVLHLDDDAGIARLSGRGASGTRLEANTGALTLNGNTTILQDQGTTVATIDRDNVLAGWGDFAFSGSLSGGAISGPGVILKSTSGNVINATADHWSCTNAAISTTYFSISANGVCFGNVASEADQGGAIKIAQTGGPSGNPDASSCYLWFDGSDLRLRIGATSYTLTKV